MKRTTRLWRLATTVLRWPVVAALALTAARPSLAQVDVDRPEMITPAAEASIAKGLSFLAQTQSREGSWRSNGGFGGDGYPVAMTALAGLAMMSGGHTPVEGEYAVNVSRAVDYLISSANPTGLIARQGEEQRSMHGHGFAMLFLAEAYGMEIDPARREKVRRVLQKAIELTGRSQSAAGGWLYSPDSGGDEGSVTVTQIQGLRACRNAGIMVPKTIIDRAADYIDKSANEDGGIRYRAQMAGPSRPPLTAAAVATLYNAGQYENPIAVKALANLKEQLKDKTGGQTFGGHQFYGTLYAGQAMYLSGDENWKGYFPHTRDWLVQTQSQDGSWQGDGVGTVYGTAIALLTLQLPYANLPILQR